MRACVCVCVRECAWTGRQSGEGSGGQAGRQAGRQAAVRSFFPPKFTYMGGASGLDRKLTFVGENKGFGENGRQKGALSIPID